MAFGHECSVRMSKGWMCLDSVDSKRFISSKTIIFISVSDHWHGFISKQDSHLGQKQHYCTRLSRYSRCYGKVSFNWDSSLTEQWRTNGISATCGVVEETIGRNQIFANQPCSSGDQWLGSDVSFLKCRTRVEVMICQSRWSSEVTVPPAFVVHSPSALGLLFCLSGQHEGKDGDGDVCIVQIIKMTLINGESQASFIAIEVLF